MAKGKGACNTMLAWVALAIILLMSLSYFSLFIVLLIGIFGYFCIRMTFAGGRKPWGGPKTSDTSTITWNRDGSTKKHKRTKTKG